MGAVTLTCSNRSPFHQRDLNKTSNGNSDSVSWCTVVHSSHLNIPNPWFMGHYRSVDHLVQGHREEWIIYWIQGEFWFLYFLHLKLICQIIKIANLSDYDTNRIKSKIFFFFKCTNAQQLVRWYQCAVPAGGSLVHKRLGTAHVDHRSSGQRPTHWKTNVLISY